jgi:uncharacterized protein YjbJ (UPF0337 family)
LIDQEKVRGQVEQLKGKLEQAVGRATRSKETQARGNVDVAKGKVRETVADVKGVVNRQAGDVQKDVTEAAEKARAAVSRLNRTAVALGAAATLVLIALIGALVRGRLLTAELSALQRQGKTAIDLGKAEVTKARATTEQFEGRLAEQLEAVTGQLRGRITTRPTNGVAGVITGAVLMAGVLTAAIATLVSSRHSA